MRYISHYTHMAALMGICISFDQNYKHTYLNTEHISLTLCPKSVDSYKLCMFHFVRKDFESGRRNFFCMGQTKKLRDMCRILELLNSKSQASNKRYIRYLQYAVFQQGIHIDQSLCYIKRKMDKKHTYQSDCSSYMASCTIYTAPRKQMVTFTGKHILIFTFHK